MPKGLLKLSLINLKFQLTMYRQKDLASMHPGRTAAIVLDGQTIGFLGQVHPQTAKNYGIPETYVAEINLSAVEDA